MNLYMPVYKRIEDEVISLTSNIFFDDAQLNVYSLTIGDIIIRCAVEIEAISKELYLRLGGVEKPIDPETGKERDLYFDTDCIQLIVDKWSIDKKKLRVTHPNIFFSPQNSVLTPLHKANKRGACKWKKAYQAIKHNRTKEIKRATLESMMNALGALYILNLYYADESFWFETPMEHRRKYENSSQIFSPYTFDATKVSTSTETDNNAFKALTDPSLEESIFILKYADDAYNNMQRAMCKMNIRVSMKLKRSKEYNDYIAQHPAEENVPLSEIASRINVDYKNLFSREVWVTREAVQGLSRKEVILNKNNDVYPAFSYFEFLQSDEGKAYVLHLENNPKELENLVILN